MFHTGARLCLPEKEIAILKRLEKRKIRAMCGTKLIEKRSSQEVMELLGLEETLDRLAKANNMQWYRHALKRESDNVSGSGLEKKTRATKDDIAKAGR